MSTILRFYIFGFFRVVKLKNLKILVIIYFDDLKTFFKTLKTIKHAFLVNIFIYFFISSTYVETRTC